jgi:hypothetical protein
MKDTDDKKDGFDKLMVREVMRRFGHDVADDDHHAMMNGSRIRQAFGLESPAGRAAGAGVGLETSATEATDNAESSDSFGGRA